MGPGTVDLCGGHCEGAALHEAVGKQTCIYSTVIIVGLLRDGVLGAANDGPLAGIWCVVSSEVFILEEAEAIAPRMMKHSCIWSSLGVT